MTDTLTLRSSLPSSLLRDTLFRGSILAIIGLALIIYSGIFLSPSELRTWGFFLVILSFIIIALGLIPYRRLTRLELNPYKLTAVERDHLEFQMTNQTIDIPFSAIEKMTYIQNGNIYGIGLHIKPEFSILKAELKSRALKYYQNRFHVDLFFPYFSQRSFHELEEWMQEDSTDES